MKIFNPRLANAGEAERRSNESNAKQRGIRDSLIRINSITEQISLSEAKRADLVFVRFDRFANSKLKEIIADALIGVPFVIRRSRSE